jgi:type VI secretion system protein ImpK
MPDIDDPFKPSDATVLRPRPGAGRRQPGSVPQSGHVAPSAPSEPSFASRSAAYDEPVASSAQQWLGLGLSPLVRAASPLLLLAGQLRSTLSVPDVGGLRRHALEEIRRFEERARAAAVSSDVVTAARYVLCAGLDEAVLSTPWGAQSEWAQQTLLVALHREAWGGEKFFDMLDRVGSDPARHIELMELQYLCLALGFRGKYQVAERGDARLAEVQRDLYHKIRAHREAPQMELSLRWRGLEDRRNPVIRYVPWWVVGAAALAVVTIAFVVAYARLGNAAAPLHVELAKVGLEDFTPRAAAAPLAGPTLKQLLAADEQAGAITVEEDGGLTRITLIGNDLFASGSATVNARYNTTLQHIAAAINKVPGRVLVRGHTDDQPLTSLRYRDNFELSRDRAVNVVKLMQPTVQSSARLEPNGAGSSEPRYKPESTPENRARNRRVEIIHVRGA